MRIINADEAKEYFHRAVRNGKQIESYSKLAEIYIAENNLPKAIEMLESSMQLSVVRFSILLKMIKKNCISKSGIFWFCSLKALTEFPPFLFWFFVKNHNRKHRYPY